MAVAVWMLYAADRLLDARHLILNPLHTGDLELRHRFHHRFRSPFLAGIFASSLALASLIPHLSPAAVHLYLVLGALLAGYFILIHATGNAHRLPKEIAVGLFFSAAVFIPTIARHPLLQPALLPAAALFALLCSLNCLFIYSWEHAGTDPRTDPRTAPRTARPCTSTPHPATRLALRHLSTLALLCLISNLALAASPLAHSPFHLTPWVLPAACSLSIVLFTLLNLFRRNLAPVTLRAAADLALLTPLVFLPLLPALHP